MLTRMLFAALAVSATLAFSASAHAAYLNMGTSNTSNATTALVGNPAGAEFLAKNANGSSASASGLYGLLTNTAPSANAAAVRGLNSSVNGAGTGVYGVQKGSGTGVYGATPRGTGVYGAHTAATGTAPGVEGVTSSTFANAWGVLGLVGSSAGIFSAGVRGENNASGGFGYGVWGSADSGPGVVGTGSSSNGIGVVGTSTGSYSVVDGTGVRGDGPNFGVDGSSTGGYGVYGHSLSSDGVHGVGVTAGVAGSVTGGGDGVYGEALGGCGGSTNPACYAGYFFGDVHVSGTLTSGVKDFQIDDPLDPAHKFLQHTSVESSAMLNLYTGNVTTDARGYATVRLPKWFQAENKNFRYQLTVIDKAHWTARAAIWDKIAHNRFTVRTDQAHVQVSWQVTGVRHDPYANANRTQVVMTKSKADQGKYLYPELYGKPKSDAIGYRKPLRAPRTPMRSRGVGTSK